MVEMSRRLLRRLSCQRLQLLPVRAGWRINPLAWIIKRGAWFALCNRGRGTRQTHRRTTMSPLDGHVIVGVESSRSRGSRPTRIEVSSVITTLAVIAATVLIVCFH